MNGNVDTRDAQLEAIREIVLSEQELEVLNLIRENRWPELNEWVERRLAPVYASYRPGGFRRSSLRLLG